MRRTVYFWLSLLSLAFISCEVDSVSPPEDLIPQKKMEAILKDVILMKSIKANFGGKIKYDSIFGDLFIYTKYNITPEQLQASEHYYAMRPKDYVIMHRRVLLKLQKMSDSIDTVIKREKDKVVKDLK